MRRSRGRGAGLAAAAIAALVASAVVPARAADAPAAPALGSTGDAVVVAVIDGSFNPYHWDFLASKMPQHTDAETANDLPLTTAPDTWLPGFPDPPAFASYDRLPITLGATPTSAVSTLQAKDASRWNAVERSSGREDRGVHYYWIPGTKVIGAVHFATSSFIGSNGAHGANTSAVSVGNFHGTCPECVVVLLTYGSGGAREDALNWAMNQPWIDVITNSYGFSVALRDRIYSGSDEALQRSASERGQTIFFSSGNGQAGDFSVPNTTYFSSQEGPDWIVTVGAVSPDGSSYSGAGKPADLASVGARYPSIGGTTVTGTGTFGGTSNATPVTAGMYARSLLFARDRLSGPSRAQDGGTIARGAPVPCAAVRPDCELADGNVTATELRQRLLHGAVRTAEGIAVGTSLTGGGGTYVATGLSTQETELLGEGHGTYFGRMHGDDQWRAEERRVQGPLVGTEAPLRRPSGEREWMIVDSYCRQSIWGTWAGGYYVAGTTALPGPDPAYPLRAALAAGCGELFPPVAG